MIHSHEHRIVGNCAGMCPCTDVENFNFKVTQASVGRFKVHLQMLKKGKASEIFRAGDNLVLEGRENKF